VHVSFGNSLNLIHKIALFVAIAEVNGSCLEDLLELFGCTHSSKSVSLRPHKLATSLRLHTLILELFWLHRFEKVTPRKDAR
jgi:hypothetical protein